MWIASLLALAGLILIGLEFFLPGGVIVALGISLLLGGVVRVALLEISLVVKITFFIGSSLGTIATCKLAFSLLKRQRKDQFILASNQENFTASSFDLTLVGEKGEVASDLKPSGHIIVGEKRLQAISEGDYIPKGKRIVISGGRGAYLVVKEDK